MKKLFGALLALVASAAFGTTTVPVQLLNPTGSISGQAIVSTGASSAPAWANIGVTSLAAIGANTILANATGSSAAPTAVAVPSCSTSSSALNWTASGGASAITCNTAINAATLGGATFASPGNIGTGVRGQALFTSVASNAGIAISAGGETVAGGLSTDTLVATSTITPSQTAGIVGTTTNNSPNAGAVGEAPSNTTTGTSVTSGTPANATSVSLTAGDWDVECTVTTIPAGSTVVTQRGAGVSTTSGTLPASGSYVLLDYSAPAGVAEAIVSPWVPLKLASTTTVYCVAPINFTTSTLTVNGAIRARRPR